jgi:sugar phosphate isomerase/epimerase
VSDPAETSEQPGTRISFGSWAFSFGPFADDPWPFDRLCKYAARVGYDGVEINGFRPHPHHDDYADDQSCASLRASIRDAGLGISGYAPDFTRVPPAEAPLEAYLAEIDATRAFCERMGISLLRTDTVSPPADLAPEEYDRRFAQLTTAWKAAAARCRRSGVTLIWEFEPGFWLNRPSEVRRVAEAVDDEGFAILFDTSHARTGVAGSRHPGTPEILDGGVPAYARLLADRIGHLHLIDNDGSLHDDETSAHLQFGEGDIDFWATLDALSDVLPRLDWWTVDFCFSPTTERDAEAAVPIVRDLLARTRR